MAITLGIIGFGGMGGWHARNACKVPGITVKGAYDIDPVRVQAARDEGLVGYDTLEALLGDKEINTVLVATPNDKHPELAIAAMDAGKNCISEKPVAMTVAELDQMIEAGRRNGVIFTVHQNRRWDKDFVTAKTVIESEDLGQIFTIQSRLHGTGGTVFGWRGEVEHGGGMLFDWGVHFLDQMYYMCGYDTFTDVYCQFSRVKTEAVEDYLILTLNTNKGYRVIIEIGTFLLHDTPRWLIGGEKGTCYIQNFDAKEGAVITANAKEEDEPVIIMTSAGPTRTFSPRPAGSKLYAPLPQVDPQWTDFYANVDAAIQGKEELIVQPWQVRKVLCCIEACFTSAKTGEVVKL